MLYFAYGSNLDWTRMRERCPAAQFLLTATLLGHEVQFTRTSRKLHCGTADIVPVATETVWGVVYHLADTDRSKLDEKEGVGIGAYRPATITVQAEGDARRELAVFTYVVCAKEEPRPKPSKTYLQHLLDGAEHWHLPATYVESLRAVETLPATEPEAARALAREVASRAIQNNPHLWDDLKYRLADCQAVDVYGSLNHMDFLSAARREVSQLSTAERELLQRHLLPAPGSVTGATYHDHITGLIFTRAKNAARRM